MKEGSVNTPFLSMGTLLGEPAGGGGGGGCFTGELEGYVKEGSRSVHYSIRAPLENMEGDSFTRDSERWTKKGSLTGCLFLSLWEGMLLSQGFQEKDESFLSGELLMGNPTDI